MATVPAVRTVPARPTLPVIAALAATALVAVVVLLEAPTPVRALVVLPWAFVVPGWAWVRRVGVADRADELVLSVAVSAVLIVLIAGTMAIVGAWSPLWGFALLAVATVVGALIPAPRNAEDGS